MASKKIGNGNTSNSAGNMVGSSSLSATVSGPVGRHDNLTELSQALAPGHNGATTEAQILLALDYWEACLDSKAYPHGMGEGDFSLAKPGMPSVPRVW